MKILISRGFGAGWSSWCSDGREAVVFMLTYQPLIEALEAGEDIGYIDAYQSGHYRPGSLLEGFAEAYKDRFGHTPYMGGARDLSVHEVNSQFIISEYDGSESVQGRDTTEWFDPANFPNPIAEEDPSSPR